MKNIYSLAIWATLISILIKLGVFTLFPGEESFFLVPSFTYMLIIPLLLFLTLSRIRSQQPGLKFANHLKEGMKSGGFYILLISGFTYIYYKWIDPEYFNVKIAARVQEAKELGYSEENIQALRETGEVFLNINFQTSVTLFGFTIYALFCGLALTAFIRKMQPL